MAVKCIKKVTSYLPWEFVGLSVDIKPTVFNSEAVPAGSKFTEYTGAIFIFDGTTWYPISVQTSIVGSLPNQTLAEQKTESDAVAGVLTFADTVGCVQIYNSDLANTGIFNVNGLNVTVPAGTATPKFVLGGIPSADVTISGATTYIVSRYI